MADTNPRKPNSNRGRFLTVLIVAALFAIGAFQTLSGSRGYINTAMDEAHLGVCGTYGDTVFVELASITDVQLVDSLSFGTCVEGEETETPFRGSIPMMPSGNICSMRIPMYLHIFLSPILRAFLFSTANRFLRQKKLICHWRLLPDRNLPSVWCVLLFQA